MTISNEKELDSACRDAIIDAYREGLEFDTVEDLKQEVIKRVKPNCLVNLDLDTIIEIIIDENVVDVVIHTNTTSKSLKCECGKDKHKFAGKHLQWCPKYRG